MQTGDGEKVSQPGARKEGTKLGIQILSSAEDNRIDESGPGAVEAMYAASDAFTNSDRKSVV